MVYQWDMLERLYPEFSRIIVQEDIKQKIKFSRVEAGQIMGVRGQACSDLIIILEGYMKIEKIGAGGCVTKLYQLGPGEICHDALNCHMRREILSLSGQAVTDMTVARIPFDIVEKFLLNDLSFLKAMYGKLYDKFSIVVKRTEKIIHEPILDRLVQYLLDKNSQNLYMTHQEIAYDLGTAREVISRQLKKLERCGSVQLERSKIKIIDMDKLKQQKGKEAKT